MRPLLGHAKPDEDEGRVRRALQDARKSVWRPQGESTRRSFSHGRPDTAPVEPAEASRGYGECLRLRLSPTPLCQPLRPPLVCSLVVWLSVLVYHSQQFRLTLLRSGFLGSRKHRARLGSRPLGASFVLGLCSHGTFRGPLDPLKQHPPRSPLPMAPARRRRLRRAFLRHVFVRMRLWHVLTKSRSRYKLFLYSTTRRSEVRARSRPPSSTQPLQSTSVRAARTGAEGRARRRRAAARKDGRCAQVQALLGRVRDWVRARRGATCRCGARLGSGHDWVRRGGGGRGWVRGAGAGRGGGARAAGVDGAWTGDIGYVSCSSGVCVLSSIAIACNVF